MTRAVVAVAVQFHCEALLYPAAVNASSTGWPVGHRQLQASFGEEFQEPLLQPAQRDASTPWRIARSFPAPGALRRRERTASTCAGVVRCRTPASWHARASSFTESTLARSTRVRATDVTGIPRHLIASLG